MEAALISWLLAQPAVAALCANRVTPLPRPEGEPLPAVTLQLIFGGTRALYGGDDQLQGWRLEFACWANSRAIAVALADEVRLALAAPFEHGGIAFLGAFLRGAHGDGDMVAGEYVHRAVLDMMIWHKIL